MIRAQLARNLCDVTIGLVVLGWCVPANAEQASVEPRGEPAQGEVMAESDFVMERSGENAETATTRNRILLASLTVFVLAVFVGFELISKVPPTLHTPLMSGSNAISGITLVGAILVSATAELDGVTTLGLLAVVFATVNVVGGFLVTHRMLSMFR